MSDITPKMTITRKTLLVGLVLLVVAVLATALVSQRVLQRTQAAGLRDMAAAALQSMMAETRSDYLASLDLKQQLSRQRRGELQDALQTVTGFLDASFNREATPSQRLEAVAAFVDKTLARQGVRLFIVSREDYRPLYAGHNVTLPEDMLDLLDESGNPVMLNFERSFRHDRQDYAWRAIYWSENNTHLGSATVYEPLDAMIVATMSLDDIRIAFELQLQDLQNDLSRVYNAGHLGSGYTFCINSNGNVLSHPFLEVGQNLFAHLGPDAGARLLLKNREEAEEQTVELLVSSPEVEDGDGMALFYRYYRPLDWFLVYAAPLSSVAPVASTLARNVLVLLLVLLPLAALALLLLGRSLAAPLQRMQELASGRHDSPPDPDAHEAAFLQLTRRSDEVGELARRCGALYRRLALQYQHAREELGRVLENQWTPAYYRVDPQLCITMCNSAFARLCGLQPEEVVGRCIAALPCSELARELAVKDRQMLQTRIPLQYELRLPQPPGAAAGSFQVFKERLQDDVATYLLDVSDQERLQAENLYVQRQASLGSASASLLHELALPLTAMKSMALRLEQFLPPGETREECANLRRELEQTLASCTHMKAMAEAPAADSGAAFSMAACVNAAAAMLRNSMQECGIAVNSHIESGDDSVLGDEAAMRQALCNILLNSREALAGHDVHPRFIVIDVYGEHQEGRKMVVVRIEDNGPGIPLELLPRVREPFFTTRHERGALGLGLYFCHRVVSEHKGRLDITSLPNRGATLKIMLPGGTTREKP